MAAIKQSSYKYEFNNGSYLVTKGIKTKFDWYLEINLTNDKDGNKRYVYLDRRVFHTKRGAVNYAIDILKKCKLYI